MEEIVVNNTINRMLEATAIGKIAMLIYNQADTSYGEILDSILHVLIQQENKNIFYIDFNRTSRFLSDRIKELGGNPKKFYFIDCISGIAGKTGEGENAYLISSPADLTKVAIKFAEVVEKTPGKGIAVFCSVSAALIYNPPKPLVKLITYLITKAREKRIGFALIASEGDAKQEEITPLIQMCDMHEKIS